VFPFRGLLVAFPALLVILGCNVFYVSPLFTASIYKLLGDDCRVYRCGAKTNQACCNVVDLIMCTLL